VQGGCNCNMSDCKCTSGNLSTNDIDDEDDEASMQHVLRAPARIVPHMLVNTSPTATAALAYSET